MKFSNEKVPLPIGRTAMLVFQINALRDECCEAAEGLTAEKVLDEAELEECARLDDALADAQRRLKAVVAGITLARLKRRSETK